MYSEEHYSKMLQSSMHDLDDLGSEYLCTDGDMNNWASYTTLTLNITHQPTSFINGLCLPKVCTPEAIAALSMNATNKFNSLLESL